MTLTVALTLVARFFISGMNWKLTISDHARTLVARKSKIPPTPAAMTRVRACSPPASPVTNTSLMAVASGKGSLPCCSATK